MTQKQGDLLKITTMFRRFLSSTTVRQSITGSGVAHVQLAKPVMGLKFWDEFKHTMQDLGGNPAVRCIVVSGESKSFSFGLDLKDTEQMEVLLGKESHSDAARRASKLGKFVTRLQSSLTVMEEIDVPVIACVHDYCFGGGMDLVCCADIRLCSADVKFSIKEVDVGMAPDLGTLQRMERLVGSSSLVRELAFTGRVMGAEEAKQCGFVSTVFPTKQELVDHGLKLAETIASKSPVAISGIKRNLEFSRNTASVKEALQYQATWSACTLQSPDVELGIAQALGKQPTTT